MANREIAPDHRFQALADPTRLAVVDRLCCGEAPVSELAAPFAMALPTFLKHLGVLEGAGLVRSEKRGRVRVCRLDPEAMRETAAWFADRRAVWEGRMDRLGAYLSETSGGSPREEDET